jgi:hypothetical protein
VCILGGVEKDSSKTNVNLNIVLSPYYRIDFLNPNVRHSSMDENQPLHDLEGQIA